MKKPMMIGMAALALTVSVTPMQTEAAGNNCFQTGNKKVIAYNGKCEILNGGVNGDCTNLKDMLKGDCTNLDSLLKGDCSNLKDILNGNCNNQNSTNQNNGCQNENNTQKPDVEEDKNDTTQDSNDQDASEDTSVHAYAKKVVELVNVERAKEGLAPLTMDLTVTNAANVRATEIQKSFSHTRPDGTKFSTVLKENGVNYSGAGENIAYGQKTPEQVVQGWMNSAGHRANIMNKSYKNIGVGYQLNNGTAYWVQLFTY